MCGMCYFRLIARTVLQGSVLFQTCLDSMFSPTHFCEKCSFGGEGERRRRSLWPVKDLILPDGRDQGEGTGMEAKKIKKFKKTPLSRGAALCGPVTLIPVSSAAPSLGRRPSAFCFLGLEDTRESCPFLPAAIGYLKPGQGWGSKLPMPVGDPHHRGRVEPCASSPWVHVTEHVWIETASPPSGPSGGPFRST